MTDAFTNLLLLLIFNLL